MRKLICLTLLLSSIGYAQEFVRSEPADHSVNAAAAANDRVQAQYDIGNPRRKWSGSLVMWYYNPASQPSNMTTDEVVSAIKLAASRWSDMCSVRFLYMGVTTSAPYMGSSASALDNKNVFGWSPNVTPGNLYDTNRWFDTFNNYIDVDLALNSTYAWNAGGVDAAMTSAIGFAIGMKTSNVSSAVMANVPSRSLAYDRTLRGDDAEGCAALYGAGFYADVNRGFNWAETTFASLLWPSPAESKTYNGYYYRYYSGTDSLVAYKDGEVYYNGADGVMQDMGALNSYKSQVRAAGF